MVGESRKRCHDHDPVSRALSSALPATLGAGRALVRFWDRALRYTQAPTQGHYYLAPAATPATAGRPRAGSDVTALSASGAAETAPPEEAARALTGVGLPFPPPPRLGPIPLAQTDPVWPARAQRPRGRGSRWKLYDIEYLSDIFLQDLQELQNTKTLMHLRKW